MVSELLEWLTRRESRGSLTFFQHGRSLCRWVDRVVRVRAAKHALIPTRSGKPELPGPRHSTGRAEKLRSCLDANRSLCLLEVTDEVGIRMVQSRTVYEVVIADLVSSSLDTGNHFRVAEGPLANQEEGCLGVVPLENLEDLGREGRVRAIIEGKGNQRKIGPNSIGDVRSESIEHTQGSEGLYPEHQEPNTQESNGRQEYCHHRPLL
jgi:hypothetical protein